MPKRCPACKKPVPADARACPYCPMSFENDDYMEKERAARIPPGLTLAAWLAVLAGLGYGAWNALSFVMRYGAQNVSGNGNPISSVAGAAAKTDAAYPWNGISARPGHLNAEDTYKGGDPAAEPPVFITPSGGQEHSGWIFKGSVYNLSTLSPIPHARMKFTDARTGRTIETRTDKNGRYELRTPILKNGGYVVVILSPRYARAYLNPEIDGVSGMSRARRNLLSQELVRSPAEPHSIQGFGAHPITRDFYLAPTESNGGNGR